MSWPSIDSKKQLRLNVLRHRQKLLKLLENVDDTTVKPRIKFDASDFDKLLGIKQEPEINIKIKKEEVELHGSSDDLFSDGSSETWNNSSLPLVVTEIDNRRRSQRVLATPNIHQQPSINIKQEDHLYALDHVEESIKNSKELPNPTKKVSVSNGQSSKSSRYKESFDRDRHNAKERECREQIAKMFVQLTEYCSTLKNSKRTPSKVCILVAAKAECDNLTQDEKKLIAEKKKIQVLNTALKKKLKNISNAKKIKVVTKR